MAKLLKGKPVADSIVADARSRAEALRERSIVPTLAVVRVGDDPGDLSYERTILKRAETAGVAVRTVSLDADVSQAVLEVVVRQIGEDPEIHGCLLFRPLPAHLDETAVCELIPAAKDVDGVTRASLASVMAGEAASAAPVSYSSSAAPYAAGTPRRACATAAGFAPSTAEACVRLLDHYGIPLAGVRATVLGRSLVVGRPLALLLTARDATVTLCHSRTVDAASICRASDIVVCATGRARMFGRDCFRDGQTVLDVGVNFDDDGEMCGDVDAAALESLDCSLTPVPGGIGSVTTAVTLDHVVTAAEHAAN